jgi:hypothetical protein
MAAAVIRRAGMALILSGNRTLDKDLAEGLSAQAEEAGFASGALLFVRQQ